jgi:hypothetical protein
LRDEAEFAGRMPSSGQEAKGLVKTGPKVRCGFFYRSETQMIQGFAKNPIPIRIGWLKMCLARVICRRDDLRIHAGCYAKRRVTFLSAVVLICAVPWWVNRNPALDRDIPQ